MKLTPIRRKAIYRVLAAVGGVLVAYGLLDAETVAQAADVVEPALLLLGSLLADRHVSPDVDE